MANETPEQLRIETEIIAKLLRESKDNGDQVSLSIEDVPAETGSYALHDGLHGRGAGVTYNMRRSIEELARNHWPLKRPIFIWKPDTDGSVALWLDGKVRCSLCESKQVVDLSYIDEHRREVHGIKDDCEC